MKSNPLFLFVSVCMALLLHSASAYAQQASATVHMQGAGMRAPMDVHAGKTTVSLCDLTPGNTYTVIALGAAQEQRAQFQLPATNKLKSQSRNLSPLPNRRNALRFTAEKTSVDLQLIASSREQATTIPMYLSVKCEDCAETLTGLENFQNKLLANLQTNGNVSATSLITNTLVGGNCFNVSNITSAGNGAARGTFSNGASNIGIANGMVLSTGNVNILPGPNNATNANGGFSTNTADDPDLGTLDDANQYDLSKIEFDFTPTANMVQFDFVFGSEEYCEYVGSQFNDVFGFFISGPGISGTLNLATLPSSSTGVTTNNVNYLLNSGYYVNNNQSSPCSFLSAPHINECQLDGWTTLLTATANVIPCSTYHIKLAIADIGDALYSSAVFLRANSFNAGGTVKAEPVYPAGQQFAYEHCNKPSYFRIFRDNSDLTQPLTVNFGIGGTATNGVDYTGLSSPVTIPAGEQAVLIPINVLPDALNEGTETIVLVLDNACSCTQSTATLQIKDLDPFTLALPPTYQVCVGDTVVLDPAASGGITPYTYAWSNAATTPTLSIVPQTVGSLYTVTVTDFCGQTLSATTSVFLRQNVNYTQFVSFCPGNGFTLNGITYTQTTIVRDTFPGQNGSCDTIYTYHLQRLQQISVSDSISFCEGSSVTIGGLVYTQPGTVVDTIPGMNGDCDTIATYYLTTLMRNFRDEHVELCYGSTIGLGGSLYSGPDTVSVTYPGFAGECDTIVTYYISSLPLNARSESVALCPGSSIYLGGNDYSSTDTVVVIHPGFNGQCDTSVTYYISVLPQPTRSESISFCPGESVTIGGVVYTQSGTVIDTIPGQNGACDTIATYTLTRLPQPTRNEAFSFCPGESVTIGGVVYTQSGTVIDTIPGQNGACDTIATYTLTLLPQPTFSKTISFCPGETVNIHGQNYTQPGTIVLTLPAQTGCDTIATYILQYSTPAPSVVNIKCPSPVTLNVPTGTGHAAVTYDMPTGSTTCVCPGLDISLTQGLASGSSFPLGSTTVCYTAKDVCGQSASCCFKVTVAEEDACDVKEIGCVKFELLTITVDQFRRRSYRIRTTNNCSNKMIYMAVQVPNGVVADLPVTNTIYTAPSGNTYLVRNPNYSPFYSIRYSSVSDSINNGESDIFKYTLPPQADPTFIHVMVKLQTQVYYEAHLNTFYCEITPENISSNVENRNGEPAAFETDFNLFPNPTDGELYADMTDWAGSRVQLRVIDAQGRVVKSEEITASESVQQIDLPALSGGVYWLQAQNDQGERRTQRFVVQH